MPDLGGRHELEHGVDHAQAGPQDGDQADPVREFGTLHRLDRRLDVEWTQAGISKGLVAQEPGEFPDHFAEFLGLRVDVAKDAQLVLDGWVL